MSRKSHVRDYSTEAFRFFARTGGKEKYIESLILDMEKTIKGSGISNPTESELINKERIITSRTAEFEDLEAVEKVLNMLEYCQQGYDIIKAIKYVYFKEPHKILEKGDIENRVHYAEIYIPASRAQIFRWLKRAENSFAEERGLRV